MEPILILLAGLAGLPEQRAIGYLSREVPSWASGNGCFSCHNNGDGARALFVAAKAGYAIPAAAIRDTAAFLSEPAKWDGNHIDSASGDTRLARIQFTASLAEAFEAHIMQDRAVLTSAAQSLLALQESGGSWPIDTGAAAGSPATYGTALATYLARRSLERADPARFAGAIRKANAWFRSLEPQSVLDTAAALLALPDHERRTRRWIERLLSAQTSDGGWGPQIHSPAEPFDTAVVLMALHGAGKSGPAAVAIERGRTFLARSQQASGGWPATTRPPGAQSYAQHISTTAWATIALLLTNPERN